MSGAGRCHLLVLVASLMLPVLPASRAAAQETQVAPAASPAAPAPPDLEQGRRLFEQNCSVCHGVNGSGEEGPDIRGVPASLGDQAAKDIARRGIAGTAMPASTTLSDREITNIVAYLRKLGAAAPTEAANGDPKNGEALYQSSGCATCHIIAGQGGSIGPELTRIGAMRGAVNLKERLQDPGTNLPKVSEAVFGNSWTQYLMFRAVEKDGRVVEGMRVGEDSFTIVLKDSAGRFHGLWKPDLRTLEKEPGKSFMPSFKDTLSSAQVDDLVAYLATLKGAQ